jgi:hypothetical protein
MQSVTTDEGLTLNIADEERLVACDNELRFMLLRHWSLYESMYHSSYVSALHLRLSSLTRARSPAHPLATCTSRDVVPRRGVSAGDVACTLVVHSKARRMVCSYLAARIGIWKEKGRDELNQFLAKMGLPLQSAKMSYSMMSSEQKKSMTSYFLT